MRIIILLTLLLSLNNIFSTALASDLYLIFDRERPNDQRFSDIKTAERMIDLYSMKVDQVTYFIRFQNFHLQPKAYEQEILRSTRKEQVKNGLRGFYKPDFSALEKQKNRKMKTYKPTLLPNDISSLLSIKSKNSDKPKTIIFFSDLDYNFEEKRNTKKNSKGGYLGVGWLSDPKSPFISKIFSLNSKNLKSSRIIVFTSNNISPHTRRGKEIFFANLFNKLGAKLYYLGPNYEPGGSLSKFAIRIFTQVLNNKRPNIKPATFKDTSILQVEYFKSAKTINLD